MFIMRQTDADTTFFLSEQRLLLECETNCYPSSSYQLGVPDFRLISAQNRYIGLESYDFATTLFMRRSYAQWTICAVLAYLEVTERVEGG
jgi:hypothetical protein